MSDTEKKPALLPDLRSNLQDLSGLLLVAIQFGLGSFVAFSVALAFSHYVIPVPFDTAMIGSMWAVISLIMTTQDNQSAARDTAYLRFVGSLVGAVMSGAYLVFFPFSIAGMAFVIAITVLVCHLLNVPGNARLPALTVAIVMVISAVNPDIPPLINAGTRFIEVIIGSGVAIGIAWLWQKLPQGSGKTG